MSDGRVKCEQCGKKYKWNAQLGGRKVRCKCGHVMRIPKDPPPKVAAPPERDAAPSQNEAPVVAAPPPPAAEPVVPPVAAAPPLEQPAAPVSEPTGSIEMPSDGLDLELPPDLDGIDLGVTPAAPLPSDAGTLDIELPPELGDAKEEDPYELAIPGEDDLQLAEPVAPAAPAVPVGAVAGGGGAAGGRCPSCGATVKAGAVICINCGFNIAAGQKIQTEIGAAAPVVAAPVAGPPSGDAVPGGGIGNFPFSSGGSSGVARALANREDEEDHMKAEYKRPAIMIGVGFGLILFNAFVMPSYEGIKEAMDLATGTDTPAASARLAVVMLSVLSMIVQFPFIFVALIVVAKMFSTSFGNLGPCVLKVAAIAIVTTGFGDCLATLMDIVTGGFGAMAGMITFPINMGVFWALSSMLLDLDFFEMVVLFLIVYLLPTFLIMFVGIGLVTMF